MLPWPQVNIDEIQAARVLYRDANLMEMYIEHAASTELNISNANIVRNVETFISPSDTTRILPAATTVFDTDYLPESKVEPEVLDQNTMFTITESMGSALGEISFPSTIKDEPNETVGQVLATHSPTCELRCGLENKLQTMLNTQSDAMEPEPSPTMEYSSDETILLTPPRPTADSQNLQEPIMALQDIMPDQVDPCLQEVSEVNEHSVNMENDETSSHCVNDRSMLQDETSPELWLQDITDSCDHGVSVENDEICSQDVIDCSNSQDVTTTELCLQDITPSVHDANAEICSQDVNSVSSQDITDTAINEVGSQDISIITNEPYSQQDVSISGLQHVTNNSSVIPDLGDSQDVISICPEQTYTLVSLSGASTDPITHIYRIYH